MLDWTDRKQVRDLIGDDAEALVYLYGACDRRRNWRDLATTGEVFDRFTAPATRTRARGERSASSPQEVDGRWGVARDVESHFRC
ncbi:DUF6817 domain-containing protein [Micromonospora sp. NPDC023737]|uniref:DUF6817 domain-containing protein n=1 Tax=unclassified Micromonospora TaxID=2617518 RepID=UPI0034011A90